MNVKKVFVFLLSSLLLMCFSLKAQVVKDADNAFRTCKYEKALAEYKKGDMTAGEVMKKYKISNGKVKRETVRNQDRLHDSHGNNVGSGRSQARSKTWGEAEWNSSYTPTTKKDCSHCSSITDLKSQNTCWQKCNG